MTLFSANTTGNATNNWYGIRHQIHNPPDLARVCGKDYTAVEFKDGLRSNKNFMKADTIVLDVDNSHSDDPSQWVTPEMVCKAFPNVKLGIHFSRHHMKEKNGKSARPRFHVIFQAELITDAQMYSEIAKILAILFPYFDNNALDAARFFYGTENPDVLFFDGNMTITEYLKQQGYYPAQNQPEIPPAASSTGILLPPVCLPQMSEEPILEGQRNTTLYLCAVRLLKRYGHSKDTYASYLEKTNLCVPPLEEREINNIWNSAVSFYEGTISQSPNYVPPEKYNRIPPQADTGCDNNGARGTPPGPNGSPSSNAPSPKLQYKPDDLTDVGQAVMLKNVYGQSVLFCPSYGYMVYNGVCWKQNKAMARICVQNLTTLQLQEAESNYQFWKSQAGNSKSTFSKELHEAKEYLRFANACRKSSNISATLKEFDALVNVEAECLDTLPFLLCTSEGTYDLRKGLAGKQPNSPDNYITKVTKYSPSDIGKDIWEEFLNTVFCGDAELIEYAQMICGLAAIGQVKVESLFIAHGDGRNGKSTFWNSIGHVLGDYFGHISAQALSVSQFSSGNTGAEMANLQGKRLCIASESREGSMLNEAAVKQITSTDDIFANPKYKDPFSFKPSHTLVLYTNHLPKVSALDDGTWRRLVIIPFEAKIQASSDKKNYAEYLETNCGGSIIAWIIEGARKIIELDYTLPTVACIQKAIGDYRSENDWLKHFLDERCEMGAGFEIQAGDLHRAYKDYAMSNNVKLRSSGDFFREMDNRGYTYYQ